MSFESGKKLGLTASLISIIVPVVTLVLYGVFLFSLFSSISNITSRGTISPFTNPFASMGIVWGAFIGIGLLSFVGLILFIIAMYQLSHYYNEPGIFRNVIYSLVVSIVGGVTLVAIVIALVFSIITSSLGRTPNVAPSLTVVIIGILVVAVAALIIGIVSMLFYKRAFNQLANKSGVHNFDTAGLLLLIGVIIPIVSWIGWILAASGFNSLKPKPTETSLNAMPSIFQSTVDEQKRICTQCGAVNNANADYCRSCGKILQ